MSVRAAILLISLCVSALADFAAGRRAFEKGDYATALKEYLPLAKQGDALAQIALGFMYHDGKGVAQDYKEASRWYRLAAEQGDAVAQSALGSMYVRGVGVTQDDKEASMWYRLAALRRRW